MHLPLHYVIFFRARGNLMDDEHRGEQGMRVRLAILWNSMSTGLWRRLPNLLPTFRTSSSVITSKAANGYHFKTGQREVAGTFVFYPVIPCRGKFNLGWPRPSQTSNFRGADDSRRASLQSRSPFSAKGKSCRAVLCPCVVPGGHLR